jgi:hypothetical protein
MVLGRKKKDQKGGLIHSLAYIYSVCVFVLV